MSPHRRLLPIALAFTHQITPASMRAYTRTTVRLAALVGVPVLFQINQPRLGVVLAFMAIAFEVWVVQINSEHARTENFLRAIVTGIEARDLHDPGHGKRVGHIGATIATHLGLSHRHVAEVRLIGHLHDIGKLQSHFADLLRRPSELTVHEKMLVESHARLGADFVSLFPDMRHIAGAIAAHHENYDGTGYPLGLSGTQIPLEGRIMRVADSMDAMLHDRPYRKAMTPELLHQELLACRGSDFDPTIVDIVLMPDCWPELLRLRQPSAGTGAGAGVVMEPQLVVESRERLRAI
jgi:HD-GYP domain-containing protein (c-di-GMP phosphodiesterase class II)